MAVLRNKYLQKNRAYFELAISAYKGGEDFISLNLIQHLRETDKHFNQRKLISFYLNIVSKVIDVLSSFVVKNISRNITLSNDVTEKYLKKIDCFQTLNKFIKKKIADYLLTGNAFALVDAFENNRAFVHDVNYLHLLDFKIESFDFAYVDFLFDSQVYRFTPQTIYSTPEENYKEENITWADEKPNSIGMVPLVTVSPRLEMEKIYLSDAVITNRAIFNHINNVGQQFWDTGFGIILLPDPGINPKTGKKIELDPDTLRYTKIPIGGGLHTTEPKYIEPELTHLQIYLDFILMLIDNLLFTINVYRDKNTTASGISKSYDYSLMVTTLEELADTFEDFENSLWETIALFDNQINPDKIVVHYSRKFDIKEIKQILDEYFLLLTMDISRLFNAQIKKLIINEYVHDDGLKQRINQEIEGGQYHAETESEPEPDRQPGADTGNTDTNQQ